MSRKFLKELGVNAFIAVAVFGWIFGQPPSADQKQKPAAATVAALPLTAGQRGDQIPSVPQAGVNDTLIRIEPATAPVPEPGPSLQSNLLRVAATSLT